MMSTVLEVNPADIKESVRRDRCDWLAAIYNLLHDQPEGRAVIQQLILDDYEELVDSAFYQGPTDTLKLGHGGKLQFYIVNVILTNSFFYYTKFLLSRFLGWLFSGGSCGFI